VFYGTYGHTRFNFLHFECGFGGHLPRTQQALLACQLRGNDLCHIGMGAGYLSNCYSIGRVARVVSGDPVHCPRTAFLFRHRVSSGVARRYPVPPEATKPKLKLFVPNLFSKEEP